MRISYKVWLVGGIPIAIAIAAAIPVVFWLLLKAAERAPLWAGAGDRQARGAVGAAGAFGGVDGDPQAVKGFRMDPLGRIPFEGVDLVE